MPCGSSGATRNCVWYGDSKPQAGAPGSENRQRPCEIVLAFLIARSISRAFPRYAASVRRALKRRSRCFLAATFVRVVECNQRGRIDLINSRAAGKSEAPASCRSAGQDRRPNGTAPPTPKDH